MICTPFTTLHPKQNWPYLEDNEAENTRLLLWAEHPVEWGCEF